MYIVHGRGFIDSVTASKARAEKQMKLAGGAANGICISKTGGTFPFFILETGRGQWVFSPSLKEISKSIYEKFCKRSKGEYIQVYTFDRAYFSKKPGVDQMGLMKHFHLDIVGPRNITQKGVNLLVKQSIKEHC